MGDKVGENPAALRAAVFLLSAKNRRGGMLKHPPSRSKVNNFWHELIQLLPVVTLLGLTLTCTYYQRRTQIGLPLPNFLYPYRYYNTLRWLYNAGGRRA